MFSKSKLKATKNESDIIIDIYILRIFYLSNIHSKSRTIAFMRYKNVPEGLFQKMLTDYF